MARPATLKLVSTFALALGLAWPAAAADDAAYVKYRQKVMSGIGADMGAISDILKNELPFTAAIAIHADSLGDAASLIQAAFQKNVTAGATDAKADIWAKPKQFKEAIHELEQAVEELEEAADDGDPEAIAEAFKGVGKACGSCHKPFRKPKEESYKNQ